VIEKIEIPRSQTIVSTARSWTSGEHPFGTVRNTDRFAIGASIRKST